jgi:hypothetical protein
LDFAQLSLSVFALARGLKHHGFTETGEADAGGILLLVLITFVPLTIGLLLPLTDLNVITPVVVAAVFMITLGLMRVGAIARFKSDLGGRAFAVLSLLLTYSFLSGMTNAYRDLSRFGPVYAVRSTSFDTKLLLLRNLEQGPLLRDPRTNSIHFVPWDDVKALSREVSGPDPKTPLHRVIRDAFWPERPPQP